MKDPKNVAKGHKNRVSGAEFERRVRKDLEEKGWIVDKWSNQVIDNKLVAARHKWNGPNRPMVFGTGFPDFVCFKKIEKDKVPGLIQYKTYEVVGVESKSNGTLTKEEKEKCRWLLDNDVFNQIRIAEKTKVKNKIVIVYHNFEEKYGKK